VLENVVTGVLSSCLLLWLRVISRDRLRHPLSSQILSPLLCFLFLLFFFFPLNSLLVNKQYKSFAFSGDHSPSEPVKLLASTPSHPIALNISVAGFSSRVIFYELNINFMPEFNEG